MAVESDYYAILGIQPEATAKEVRSAFRERVRACHPDRVANLDPDLRRLAEEKMVQLNEAYAVLRNSARRTAYDERRRQETSGPVIASAAAAAEPTLETEGPARSRIGEQVFVARAATEEFEACLKQTLGGHTEWVPVAFPGTTLALKGTRGRHDYYFILVAGPHLDEKTLLRFLRQLKTWAGKLKGKWWGRELVVGFAGAVEFTGTERLRRLVEQFNSRSKNDQTLGQATLIDLVNWKVFPGETDLGSHLQSLIS